jgi:hypothetical protein
MVQAGLTPFFFTPAYFLVMNPLSMTVFASFVVAAIRLRRTTAWHRRLMLSGMAMLLAPALGRLLPMPLLVPWSGLAVFAVLILFPLAGMFADWRRTRAVHPAWLWSLAVLLGMQLVIEVVGRSDAGAALVGAVTAGTPGATVDPLGYPPPPLGLLIAGR